jgi:hypothetical protein
VYWDRQGKRKGLRLGGEIRVSKREKEGGRGGGEKKRRKEFTAVQPSIAPIYVINGTFRCSMENVIVFQSQNIKGLLHLNIRISINFLF